MPEPIGDDDAAPGRSIIRASWWGTAALAGAAVVGVAAGEPADVVVSVVALPLFAAGIGAFAVAYGTAVRRSRTDAIGMGGLFFLAGSAPASVRRQLLGSLAAQTIVALVAASLRPFTAVAFGVLVPMYGLGLAGMWGARHGVFSPRAAPGGRTARSPEVPPTAEEALGGAPGGDEAAE